MYPNFFKDISYRKYGVLVVRFVNIFNFNKRSAKKIKFIGCKRNKERDQISEH